MKIIKEGTVTIHGDTIIIEGFEVEGLDNGIMNLSEGLRRLALTRALKQLEAKLAELS